MRVALRPRLVRIMAAIAIAASMPCCRESGRGADGGGPPDYLPPCAQILFVSNKDAPPGDPRRTEIYSMDATGGNVARITYSVCHHFILGVDASHRYIVASRAETDTDAPAGLGDEDRRSIWIIDLADGLEWRLTSQLDHAEGRTFSPDGEWVVFSMKLASQGEDQMDLYKIRRDGADLARLTNTLTCIESDAAWSHDGSRIAYAFLDGLAADPRFVLNTMAPDGTDIRLVYDGGPGVATAAFPPGNFDPAWSPDDQWIVFERAVQYTSADPENFGSGIWHIQKVRSDGSTAIALDLSAAGGHSDRAEYLPSFSADGTRIVFGAVCEANPLDQSFVDILSMAPDGAGLVRLTFAQPNKSNMYPVWVR